MAWENVREFAWQHLVNFDMEYFLLLLIISHYPTTIYHLLLLIALFLYWYREKASENLDMLRLFVRFVLCHKIFYLNFLTGIIHPSEFYYYTFMWQLSKSLFNYFYSTGYHTLNNFNYDFSLSELITLNFTIFVAVSRQNFTIVGLYMLCTVVHYATVLAYQLYLSYQQNFVMVEKSGGSGDTAHFSLILPVGNGETFTSRSRFDIVINQSNKMEMRQVKYQERNRKWWNKYFIPFSNVGIIGQCMNPFVSAEHVRVLADTLMPDFEDYNTSYESCQEFVFRLADEIMTVSLGIQSSSTKSLMICLPFVIVNLILIYFNVDFAWKKAA